MLEQQMYVSEKLRELERPNAMLTLSLRERAAGRPVFAPVAAPVGRVLHRLAHRLENWAAPPADVPEMTLREGRS